MRPVSRCSACALGRGGSVGAWASTPAARAGSPVRAVNWPGSGAVVAMRRLMRAINTWRQVRVRRRRAKIHRFMALSDRILADIGLRRADVNAAMIGVVPLGRRATLHAPAGAIRQVSTERLALVANDLSEAASAPVRDRGRDSCRCAGARGDEGWRAVEPPSSTIGHELLMNHGKASAEAAGATVTLQVRNGRPDPLASACSR